MKIFRYTDHINGLQTGQFLPPIMVDVDVVGGICNLDCQWCCQARSRASRPPTFMARKTMEKMGPFCADWGVKAWRIGGDSEPLLNKEINVLFESGNDADIEMGLITNGVLLDRIERPELLSFLGVSLDAARADTWQKLKRAPKGKFGEIIERVKKLRDRCPELDLSLKFLRFSSSSITKAEYLSDSVRPKIRPRLPSSNKNEVDEFVELANQLGCNFIIKDCYSSDFRNNYQFSKCWVTPLSGVFDASHRFDLCCDARGKYVLTDDFTRDDWSELKKLWGSETHRKLISSIKPSSCVGCAKYKQNESVERYVEDKTNNFI